ncbi:crotonase/enoyl-CoA hydratase family protein [Actibacterium sp. 188UL27-1]|uniref:crotonase/enoyl-CoA hydratase family protein n=1 Tax=Actibacterium sp. 188UL27-1 TaxID=2786961 RepID=UPI001958B7FC|nr:crotonase/enoyl-CoA hydratase family protein [Actibacterium sp. 188UL27-1]MBM7067770.1 crotonase/enoyl-CoA hydratase family protein [Actibacterium sp. 188UL27-1]
MALVEVSVDGRGVALVVLSRAEKHNAMSAEMIAELHQLADRLAADSAVRVVVLTGAGRSFCAGGDLGWMQAQMAADAATRAEGARALAAMLGEWNELPKPVVGRVQGNAFGGGIGLMAVCDVVVAVEGAKFALTETRLGLIPATIGPYVLARMGEGRARRVFMSGRVFGALEAQRLDLVAQVVATDGLDAAVEAEVVPYLACAPGAVAAAKALARRLGPVIDADAIDESIDALVACWEGDEAPEGVGAFFDKRKACWVRT